jgi:hypothetical protein
MNYRITGHDGKIYGPASAEQIKQWIAEGRVDSRTPVFVEGTTEWTFAGLLPEFAGYFQAAPRPSAQASAPPLMTGQYRKANSLAVWSLVLGIASWVLCCCFCPPLNLVAIVLGIIALVQINEKNGAEDGRAQAILGIVLGGLNVLWAIGCCIAQMTANHGTFTANFN